MKGKLFIAFGLFAIGSYFVHSQKAILDSTFNMAGTQRTVIGKTYNNIWAVLGLSDGKFLSVGNSNVNLDNSITLVRYNGNGTPDHNFGREGVINSGPLGGYSSVFALAAEIQTDGKIVIAGNVKDGSVYHPILIRFLANGQLDPSFNSTGYRIVKMSATVYLNSIKIQADGKIVAAGEIRNSGNTNIIALRLTGAGNLDTGFGTNGMVTIDINGTNDYCNGMAISSGGSIFLAGYTLNDDFYKDITVLKLNSTGKKDNTFNQDGIIITDIGGFDDESSGIALQSDGKILVTGYTDEDNNKLKFATIRYTSSGNLDSSFDQDGIALTQLGNISSEANSVMVQNDGKILCVGSARMADNIWNIALARYTTSGALDPSFSGDGKTTTNYMGTETGRSFLIQPDGSLVVWGTTGVNGNSGALFKYTKTGNIDPNFGNNGVTVQELYQTHSYINDIMIQSDGKIIAGGTTSGNYYNGLASARYLSNGILDTSFSRDGILESFLFVTNLEGKSVAIQSDGKIVLQGIHKMESKNNEVLLVRYLLNGNLDDSFGTNGKVNTDVGSSDDVGTCMLIQSDNKIVVAGYAFNGQNDDFMLVRYLPNGSLDNTFSADGKIIMSFGSSNDGANAIALQKDGKILVGGYTEINNEMQFAVMRFTSQGNLDQTFNNNGKLSIDVSPAGSESIKAMKIQSDGKIILVGDAFNGTNNDFAIVRINPNGTLDQSFSGDGKLMIDINSNYNEAADMEILQDGKIIIGGTCILNQIYKFALARITSDGMLDSGFGESGIAIISVGPENDILSSLAQQPDGKLILGGSSTVNYRVEFSVARVLTKLNVGVLDQESESIPIQIYPNPIGRDATIEFGLTQEDAISIELTDMLGNTVQRFIHKDKRAHGIHIEKLSLEDKIKPGPYLLKINNSKQTIAVKVIKGKD